MVYEDLAALIERVRIDNDDIYDPYKWSDIELGTYLSAAQDFLCDELNLIPDVLTISYTADNALVGRPAYVTQVRHVYDSVGTEVELISYNEWQRLQGSAHWRTETGDPGALIEDMHVGYWRLDKLPLSDGTLSVDVYRRALEPLSTSEVPELMESLQQEAMILGARAQSYRKQDADIFDDKQADRLDEKFHMAISQLETAVKRKQRRPGTVLYGGI